MSASTWLTSYTPTRIPQGRIIVTGGAGFIGSALIWALNRGGHRDILVVDRLGSSSKFRNLVPLSFCDYLEADDFIERLEQKSLRDFGPIGTVIHLGACSATTEKNALYLLRNNYEYTKRVAAATIVTSARFVYASSAATYGQRENILDDAEPLQGLRPVNMYAYSKHLFDLYAEREGFLSRIVGVKYFNVFGPNEQHKGEMRSVIAKAYDQLQTQDVMNLFRSHRPEYRDGEQQRDFVYVKDAVDATLFLAATPEASGIYNVGSGGANTWNTLMNNVFSALGREPKIAYIDMPESLRSAYQYSTIAALHRLRSVGYTRPITSLRDAIFDYIPYLQQDQRLDPLLEA